jgi:hypothetical protein
LGAQAADVLLEDELEDEPDDAEDAGFALLPESELLLSEPDPLPAAELAEDPLPRLSVR